MVALVLEGPSIEEFSHNTTDGIVTTGTVDLPLARRRGSPRPCGVWGFGISHIPLSNIFNVQGQENVRAPPTFRFRDVVVLVPAGFGVSLISFWCSILILPLIIISVKSVNERSLNVSIKNFVSHITQSRELGSFQTSKARKTSARRGTPRPRRIVDSERELGLDRRETDWFNPTDEVLS